MVSESKKWVVKKMDREEEEVCKWEKVGWEVQADHNNLIIIIIIIIIIITKRAFGSVVRTQDTKKERLEYKAKQSKAKQSIHACIGSHTKQ